MISYYKLRSYCDITNKESNLTKQDKYEVNDMAKTDEG